jgi:uncharacterized protein (TIGR02058 family)|tara:strand:+ start:73 stop:468 length:396 start_codon:yes stop_codon:yes gene_type:complete
MIFLDGRDERTKSMTRKRMVIEMGMGTDIRGKDYTKAACRALKDALWHNSLGIADIMGVDVDSMWVEVHIGIPQPEKVNVEEVLSILPHGTGQVSCVKGGLEIENTNRNDFTIIANAAAIVYLDAPEGNWL